MGLFRFELEAVGGHGCNRGPRDGDSIEYGGCRRMDCPDCLTRELTERLKRHGVMNLKAVFTHWPGELSQVTDDYVTNIRAGKFAA